MEVLTKDLCFLVTLYKEIELCKWTLSNIREHHKDSHIICISDGVEHPSMPSFSRDLSVTYKKLPHLKTLVTGGLWVERYLQSFLDHSFLPYLVKLDPDTGVHRTITSIPNQADVFGTYRNGYLDSNSCGFTREAAKKILNSNYLIEDIYNIDNCFTYRDKYKKINPSTDKALFHVVDRLGLILTRWSEVRSTSSYTPNPDLTYALTHPNQSFLL